MNIIPKTEKEIKCDTLLLSLGLIPENELSRNVGIQLDDVTGGPIVDQYFETSLPGVFACGNCLQVYDTVDILALDANIAGKNAACNTYKKYRKIKVNAGNGIHYVVPQIINEPGKIHFSLRVENPFGSPYLHVIASEKVIFKKKLPWANPANMISFNVNISSEIMKSTGDLEVLLNDK
jgi:hypothetical protein